MKRSARPTRSGLLKASKSQEHYARLLERHGYESEARTVWEAVHRPIVTLDAASTPADDVRRMDWLDDDLSRLIAVAAQLHTNETLVAAGHAELLSVREVVDGLMLEEAMQDEGAKDVRVSP